MIPVTATRAPRSFIIALSTVIAGAFATGACGPAEPEFQGPIDIDTYVVVMSELADLGRFPPPGSDETTRSARADSVRRDILEQHGVTPDELLEFAESAGANPDLMVEIIDRIVVVSDSLARRRTGAGRAADSVAATADSVTTTDSLATTNGAVAADSTAAIADSVRDAGLASDSAAQPSADPAARGLRDSLPLRRRLPGLLERRDGKDRRLP